MTPRVDCVVVGAGVIGLAIARALAIAGRSVVVCERAAAIGTETSARNSEVIHAGIHYRPGSRKARMCVEGRHRLYAYCAERGIGHRRTGKLIVATEQDQVASLTAMAATARANGVDDLLLLDAAEVARIEPALRCHAALLSPSTGILDSHGFMLALLGDAQDHGATIAYATEVRALRPTAQGVGVIVAGDPSAAAVARTVVNAGGLHAVRLARGIEGLPVASIPTLRLAKGSYFLLHGRAPFSRLIYPVPVDGGLGVHLTLDLAHAARFGPDVEWVDRIDYRVDPARAAGFYEPIRRYWPGLADGSLRPGYAGIRPKLASVGGEADFVIDGPAQHGIPGIVNLFGIESPGLTASLALADEVVRLVEV